MKYIFFILFFLNISGQEAFLLGNKFFKEKEYVQAINSYNKIKHKGFGAWFNIGISNLKLDNYLGALVAFKRAERIANYKEINLVNQNLERIYNKVNLPFKPSHLIKFLKFFSFIFLQLILILLIYSIFALIYKRKFFQYVVVLSTLFIFFGIIYFLKSKIALERKCIVTGLIENDKIGEIDLYVGPGQEFHKIYALNFGLECKIKKEVQDWFLINCKNKNGWIKKNDCTEV
ncbi:hypothetical protein A3F66_02180 [candidate division TM6 bacterium RIFCSPHIGHO2_12_FULL_32_22]|nr:MAG: hypothetical protein A3F66_02180 [candidate division TM6 bacterium RIFCSPHIGHO2_12_FULL_32_22]